MESLFTFGINYINLYKSLKLPTPTEEDIISSYDIYLDDYKEAHSTPSQTDTLIVENLRAHLEHRRTEYNDYENDPNVTDDVKKYYDVVRYQIFLLEEILSLQKPV